MREPDDLPSTPQGLHLRATVRGGLRVTAMLPDNDASAGIERKLKELVSWQWRKAQLPMLNDRSWEAAVIEVLSQDTLRYIEALEDILERLQADPATPDAVLDEIDRVLR